MLIKYNCNTTYRSVLGKKRAVGWVWVPALPFRLLGALYQSENRYKPFNFKQRIYTLHVREWRNRCEWRYTLLPWWYSRWGFPPDGGSVTARPHSGSDHNPPGPLVSDNVSCLRVRPARYTSLFACGLLTCCRILCTLKVIPGHLSAGLSVSMRVLCRW